MTNDPSPWPSFSITHPLAVHLWWRPRSRGDPRHDHRGGASVMAPSPSTIAHGGAGALARAKGTPFCSSSPSSDHTKARSTGALSRGHCARGVVRVDHVVKVRPTFTRPTVDAFTSLNWPGLRVRRFSRIPDRRAAPSLSQRRRPVRISSSIRTGRSIYAVKLTLGLVQHLPTHMLSELLCGRYLAQSLRLSSSRSLDGSKTIEKVFGDGRISFGGQRNVFLG